MLIPSQLSGDGSPAHTGGELSGSGSGCSFLMWVLTLFPLSEGHRENPAREVPLVPQECREWMALT